MDKKYFSKRPDIVSLAVVALHLAVAIAPVYISAASESAVVMVLCWFLFGVSMHGIMNLMHECCHYHVFQRKRGSEILGKYVIAPLVFADFEGYRQRHWDHHKFLGVEGETKDAYLIDIKGSKAVSLLFSYLFAQKAFKMFRKQFNTGSKTENPGPREYRWIRTALIFQLFFFGSILMTSRQFFSSDWTQAFFHSVIVYVFVYAYGLVSLTVLVANMRSIAEHQHFSDTEPQAGYAALRNFKCNPISRYIMGTYGFGEHYTHHKVPGVPYYHLREMTEDLSKEDLSLKPKVGYFQLLANIIKSAGH